MTVLLIDTFETTNDAVNQTPDVGTGYTVETAAGSGVWRIDGDRLVHGTAEVFNDKTLLTFDDEPAANSDVRFWWRFDAVSDGSGDEPCFAVARFTDTSNFYVLGGYKGTAAGLKIEKNVAGTFTSLASTTSDNFAISEQIEVHISDGTKELIIDGTQILTTSDNAHTSGKYGFAMGNYLVAGDDVNDNWRIEHLVLIEDDSEVDVADKFHDTDATTLASHTPNIGTTWTRESGTETFEIDNTSLFDGIRSPNAPTSDGMAYTVTPAPGGAEYDLYCMFRSNAGEGGSDEPTWLIARRTDGSNYYLGGRYPGSGTDKGLALDKNVSGTKTRLVENTGFSVPSEGGVLHFEIRDAAKKVTFRFNGTNTEISSTDDVLTSAGSWGIGMGNIGNRAADDLTDGTEILFFAAIEVAAAADDPDKDTILFALGQQQPRFDPPEVVGY